MPLTVCRVWERVARAQIYSVCNWRGIRFCPRARRDIHGHVSFGLFAKMPPLPDGFTYGQWGLVYNTLSFGIAGMGSATIFFWLQLPNVTKNYRTALHITELVTAIATYHYVRIFNSWVDAFEVKNVPHSKKLIVMWIGY